jgi:diguanylate cyclase (GGDEF)-like protein
MNIISLKRHLDASESEVAARNGISLLLDAAVENAVRADAQDYESLRQDVARLREVIGSAGESTLDLLLVNVGGAAQAIRNYNSRTTRTIWKQSAELRNIITMLTQAMVKIAGSSAQSAGALETIKSNLASASGIEDLLSVRHKLGDCLKLVCTEVERQKAVTDGMIAEMQKHIDQVRSCVIDSSELDHATALPLRTAAEKAMSESLRTHRKTFVLTIVMDRLQSINARFGHNRGDQVLRALRKHLDAELIERGDHLFRWTGPAIVGLLERDQELNQVRSAARRMLETVGQGEFDIGGRTVLIPLSVAWSVIALIPPAENAPKYIERFVASQTPRDFV